MTGKGECSFLIFNKLIKNLVENIEHLQLFIALSIALPMSIKEFIGKKYFQIIHQQI